jgi:hypothetical protein
MAFAVPAFGDDTAPNKDEYTLWNPTPDADMRSFNTDRPPKANSPYTVDAGHFQYETDIAVFSYGDSGGVRTRQWTLLDPTLKLGLTNRIDAELGHAAGGGRHGALDFLVNVSHPLDARWTFYSEVFTTQSWEARTQPLYTLDEALTFAQKSNVQGDFGGNFGLNGAAPKAQLYGGLSQRF